MLEVLKHHSAGITVEGIAGIFTGADRWHADSVHHSAAAVCTSCRLAP